MSKMMVGAILLLLMAGFASVSSHKIYAQETAAPVSDICSAAGDSSFCQERDKLVGGSNPVDNSSSPILGPSSIMYKIVQTVTVITGAVSVIMIVVGGFRYVISGGDSNATKGAKDTVLYAVIGLAITIFAQTIITFVLSAL